MVQPRDAEGQVPHVSFYQLASELGLPMPMELLYLQRLKLLFHVMGVQDPCIIRGILANFETARTSSWLYGAAKSIKWVRSQVGNFVVPEELDDLHEQDTWTLFAPYAKKLQQSFKKVQQSHLLKVRAFCAVKDHSIRQNQILQVYGLDRRSSQKFMKVHISSRMFIHVVSVSFPRKQLWQCISKKSMGKGLP